MCSGVFLTNVEVFGNVIKQFLKCLIELLHQSWNYEENRDIKSSMLIKITYQNHHHGSDYQYLCFNLMKLYFPLAEEQNKWKMFSHTPLGPGPEGLFFESRAQCILSVAVCCPPFWRIVLYLIVFSKFLSPLPLLFVVRYHECEDD